MPGKVAAAAGTPAQEVGQQAVLLGSGERALHEPIESRRWWVPGHSCFQRTILCHRLLMDGRRGLGPPLPVPPSLLLWRRRRRRASIGIVDAAAVNRDRRRSLGRVALNMAGPPRRPNLPAGSPSRELLAQRLEPAGG